MMKINWTLLFFILAALVAKAQTNFNGKVIDASNQKTIEFVNIGVLNSMIGTVSNEQGKFSLKGVPEKGAIYFSSITELSLHDYKLVVAVK